MRKLNFKLMKETIEWPHRRKGSCAITLPANTSNESYRLFKICGAEGDSALGGVGDYNETLGTYSLPMRVHGRNIMGGEEFMEVHAALGISKITASIVSGCYTTTPMPEYNGTVIIGPPLVNFKKNTPYTLALHLRYLSSATKRSIAMRFDYSDGTFDAPVINSTSREFRRCFTSDPNKQLVAISSHAENAANIRYGIDGFGLFEGAHEDYDTVFEAYRGFRHDLTLEAPLRKIDFSGDELDLLSGEVTRKIKAAILDGDCEIEATDDDAVFKINLPRPARRGTRMLTDFTGEGEISVSDDGCALLKIEGVTNEEDIRSYLSTSPISVSYVLKDYETEEVQTVEFESYDEELTMNLISKTAPSRIIAEYV